MSAYYFDDEEEGLARETSHPFFVEHARADFYYDLGDEFSPFGNDAGADTLFRLEDWYRESLEDNAVMADDVATLLRDYLAVNLPNMLGYVDIAERQGMELLDLSKEHFYTDIDQTIIATAFGQYKIAGMADKQVVNMAVNALSRQRYLADKAGKKSPNLWPLAKTYLQRLEKMSFDLSEMTNKKAR
jgi:uncharacterized protein YfeS